MYIHTNLDGLNVKLGQITSMGSLHCPTCILWMKAWVTWCKPRQQYSVGPDLVLMGWHYTLDIRESSCISRTNNPECRIPQK